jgi:GT2 family glycosyltransferase
MNASVGSAPTTLKVSCLLVNYFSAETLGRALHSVLAQQLANASLQIALDVVVVDNSVDAQEARQLQEKMAALPTPSNISVQLILNPTNTGFGEGNNLAFAKCQGDMVMLLNPDARMGPHCLLSLAEALHQHDGLGACCPQQFWDDAHAWQLPPAWLPSGIGTWTLTKAHHDARTALRLSNAYRNLALQSWLSSNQTSTQTSPPVVQRALSGGAMMVRRSAIAGPLFDPAYFMYFEDSDLSLRLTQQGWTLAMVPDAHLVHEWTHSAGKVAMMEASKAHYFERHFNGRGQWQRRLAALTAQSKGALDNPLGASDVALTGEDWSVKVPQAWADAWLLEASPSPLLIPSVGQLGSGQTATVTKELLSRMSFAPEGSQQRTAVYVRLGPAKATRETLPVFKLDLN